ncbi:hypothetical protein ABHN11_24475 [Brevibacillus centrosporus]|uniref:type II secretion system F family protein n=1 Tax=Brevibacillus centrosporus TaxID=54910 RepID=UPI003D2271F3
MDIVFTYYVVVVLSLPLFYMIYRVLIHRTTDEKTAAEEFLATHDAKHSTTKKGKPKSSLAQFLIRSEEKRKQLQADLEKSGSKKTIEQFMLERIRMSVITFFCYLILAAGAYFFLPNLAFLLPVFLVMAAVGAIFFYFIPEKQLKDRLAARERRISRALPETVQMIINLREAMELYDAIGESVSLADPVLKPYLRQLHTDMDVFPGESTPFHRFGESLGIHHAKKFALAMSQSLRVDDMNAAKIFSSISEDMKRLQEELDAQIIKERPGQIASLTQIQAVIYMLMPIVAMLMQIMTKLATLG